jgi:hypothetical protein
MSTKFDLLSIKSTIFNCRMIEVKKEEGRAERGRHNREGRKSRGRKREKKIKLC